MIRRYLAVFYNEVKVFVIRRGLTVAVGKLNSIKIFLKYIFSPLCLRQRMSAEMRIYAEKPGCDEVGLMRGESLFLISIILVTLLKPNKQ